MELIFLDRNSLAYKDHGFVDNNFEINQDIVIIKKSTFVVNKSNINTSIGDVVVLRDNKYFYIGLIETIEISNSKQTTISTLDFKEIFNFVVPVFSYSGNIASFIETLISTHLINSNDSKQNLSYLMIVKETNIEGQLTFEHDKLITIQDIIELISKTYGVSIKTEVTFMRGRITGIKLRIVEVTKGAKIKSNLSAITDLIISDSETITTNKIMYYPKEDNKLYKNIITYFLLKNGEISQNSYHSERYKTVNLKSYIYSDSDYNSLEAKAKSELLSSRLDHNITFNLKSNNSVIKPQESLNIGDFIEFITQSKIYNSIVTGISYKNTLKFASITLGEYRIKLTEKIQLLNKNVNSAVGNISIQMGSTKSIDGGEY